MKTMAVLVLVLFALLFGRPIGSSQSNQITVTAKNDLAATRPSETIVLAMKAISKRLQAADWKRVHVTERGSARELVTQAIDTDSDGAMDVFLFQSDFKSQESKSFILTAGDPKTPTKDQFKAYGRFVRERYDDFAWENDRIAHRMYGAALETWQAEPLTSSAVDVWTKRVRCLVINDWYMLDNYHTDNGEGGDFYSAGRSRGCGGTGVWDNGKLYVSRNFINTKVIANGPIRVEFELTYAPWDANGRTISEVKRITLDAGQNFGRFECYYKPVTGGPIAHAIGIKKWPGSDMQSSRPDGWLRTWEPLQKGQAGNLGCGIIVDPATIIDFTEAEGNYLVAAKVPPDQRATYYAGFGWDKSGDFANASDWDAYVQQFAGRLRSPLKLSISPESPPEHP